MSDVTDGAIRADYFYDRPPLIPAATLGGQRRSEVTRLLAEIQGGRREATDRVLPLVYAELRRIADYQMARERPGQTLEPTALVHEAYLRLIDDRYLPWENRAHFFAAAAEAMRRILLTRARRAMRLRHGGGQQRLPLDTKTPEKLSTPHVEARPEEFLALNMALDRLEERDLTMCQVVKLRHFAGLTIPETAECLGISPRSVNRLWTAARAWLELDVRGNTQKES